MRLPTAVLTDDCQVRVLAHALRTGVSQQGERNKRDDGEQLTYGEQQVGLVGCLEWTVPTVNLETRHRHRCLQASSPERCLRKLDWACRSLLVAA